MKFFFRILLVTIVTACSGQSNSEAGNPHSGSVESVKKIYAHMQEYGDIGMHIARDESYHPQNLLPKMHEWLSEGKGLLRRQVGGQSVLLLKRIPESVSEDLERITFPDTFNSGLAILQARFWRQARYIQEMGLSVGFLVPDPSFIVAGVFYAERWTIAVDAFANAGVLVHELRHFYQYRAVSSRGRVRPTILEQSCLEGVSRFFGELDATTQEMPTWTGVFQTLEVTPEWHRTAVDGSDPIRFPQIDVLGANLGYPGKAYSDYVQPVDCPETLKSALRSIIGETEETAGTIAHDLASKLFGFRMTDFFDWTTINQKKNEDKEIDRARKEVASLPQTVTSVKNAIDAELTAARPRRVDKIVSALRELPAGMQRDLCRYASGYEFLFDCRDYLGKEKK